MSVKVNDIIPPLTQSNSGDLLPLIRKCLQATEKIIVVLDDDPTGTQTVHDVPVLTVWDVASLEEESKRGTTLFYILTNSRSLYTDAANALHIEVANNIKIAFEKNNKDYILISRGDSTLRGHYPHDIYSLAKGLYITDFHTAIIPAFFEGGRYTIHDVHYVQEGETLIPVAETAFAKDKAFAFTQSDLKNWIEEKTNALIKASDVISFSTEELRTQTTKSVSERIKTLPPSSVIIVNAADYYDLQKFALAYLQSGENILFRTAASFVKALAGIETIDLLNSKQLIQPSNKNGGIIIAGSYVEKTTKQLQQLKEKFNGEIIELDVEAILQQLADVKTIAGKMNNHLQNGKDVLIYTSRNLVVSKNEHSNLSINQTVADFITALAASLTVQPKWFIAKGGITSSDIAVKSLGIKRAFVKGQALAGIPVWQTGVESKFPGMNYIIFPGNVGSDNTLFDLYKKMSSD